MYEFKMKEWICLLCLKFSLNELISDENMKLSNSPKIVFCTNKLSTESNLNFFFFEMEQMNKFNVIMIYLEPHSFYLIWYKNSSMFFY